MPIQTYNLEDVESVRADITIGTQTESIQGSEIEQKFYEQACDYTYKLLDADSDSITIRLEISTNDEGLRKREIQYKATNVPLTPVTYSYIREKLGYYEGNRVKGFFVNCLRSIKAFVTHKGVSGKAENWSREQASSMNLPEREFYQIYPKLKAMYSYNRIKYILNRNYEQ